MGVWNFIQDQVLGMKWLNSLIGAGIGAVIHNRIPETWIERILGGGNPLDVLFATAVGVPMYADIFGTIPWRRRCCGKARSSGRCWRS